MDLCKFLDGWTDKVPVKIYNLDGSVSSYTTVRSV